MKKLLLLLAAWLISHHLIAQGGSVGIGTNTPHSSAALDIQSTDKGVLIPRMTSAQRNAISNASVGLLVFDNTTSSFWFKTATEWKELIDTASSLWKRNGVGDNIKYDTGNVGIGKANPEYHLHINRNNPTLGFTDAETGQFSGYMFGNAKDLTVAASRVLFTTGETPGNLLLQTSAGFALAGNVGVGKTNPVQKLSVAGEIGIYNGNDTAGIISSVPAGSAEVLTINARLGRASNQPQNLVLQRPRGSYNLAGNVGIGTDFPTAKLDVSGSINTSFDLTANGSVVVGQRVKRANTGNANFLPVAHGRVGHEGTIDGGSGNFSVSKVGTGMWDITVTNVNPETCTMVVTGTNYANFVRTFNYDTQGTTFRVYCYYTRTIFIGSFISNVVSEPIDSAFSFIVIPN